MRPYINPYLAPRPAFGWRWVRPANVITGWRPLVPVMRWCNTSEAA